MGRLTAPLILVHVANLTSIWRSIYGGFNELVVGGDTPDPVFSGGFENSSPFDEKGLNAGYRQVSKESFALLPRAKNGRRTGIEAPDAPRKAI